MLDDELYLLPMDEALGRLMTSPTDGLGVDLFQERIAEYGPNKGSVLEIDARSLVPGDVIILERHRRLPADVRLISCSDDFVVDGAAVGSQLVRYPRPQEDDCVAYLGSSVLSGSARAVVIHTGPRTRLGQLIAAGQFPPRDSTELHVLSP